MVINYSISKFDKKYVWFVFEGFTNKKSSKFKNLELFVCDLNWTNSKPFYAGFKEISLL